MKTNRSHRLLGVAGVLVLAACSSLLDVKNPNNVNQSDLSNPASAASQASGVLASVARAWGQIITPYSVATDELTWIGSRDRSGHRQSEAAARSDSGTGNRSLLPGAVDEAQSGPGNCSRREPPRQRCRRRDRCSH